MRSYLLQFFYFQSPFSSLNPGTETWTAGFDYPSWGKFLIVVVILVSILPTLIFILLKWPKNWLQGFKRTFASGIANYLPDPSSADASRRKSAEQMEQEILAKKAGIDAPSNGKPKLS